MVCTTYRKLQVNSISGVMVSMLISSVVDNGFKPRSSQINDYEIGICCFSAKLAAFRSTVRAKTDRLAIRIMSTCVLLFQ